MGLRILFECCIRRAADDLLPYDGLPSPSMDTTDKDVRRTAGKFSSAARLISLLKKPSLA